MTETQDRIKALTDHTYGTWNRQKAWSTPMLIKDAEGVLDPIYVRIACLKEINSHIGVVLRKTNLCLIECRDDLKTFEPFQSLPRFILKPQTVPDCPI